MAGRWGTQKPVWRVKEVPRRGDLPRGPPSSNRGSPLTANLRSTSSEAFWKLAVSFSSWICRGPGHMAGELHIQVLYRQHCASALHIVSVNHLDKKELASVQANCILRKVVIGTHSACQNTVLAQAAARKVHCV